MFFFKIVVLCNVLEFSLALMDFCDINKRNYSTSTPGIQLTKELSASEYAVLSSFKSLHCCAKGYTSIEWFKDGKAYPWPGDVSSFILYPESANQTIYSQALGSVDAGNYTCTVANESQVLSHTAALTVFDMRKNYMDIPLPTYNLPSEHFVRLGQTARLFCEAFVGKIDLPDATNEVWWERTDFNMTAPEGKRFHQKPVSREESQVVGAYLFIEKVNRVDLGEYICSVSNTEDQVIRLTTLLKEEDWDIDLPSHKIPWLKLQFIIIFALAMSVLIAFYKRFAPSVFLFLKLKFSRRPLDDGKEYDVLICHSEADTEWTVSVLASTLQNQYHHTVNLCKISNTPASADLQSSSTMSRRLLIVLSPQLFENQWTPTAICPLIRQLCEIHDNIVCVPLQALQMDISWKSEEGLILRQLLAKCSIADWQDNTLIQRRRFWTNLRLSLPPPVLLPINDSNNVTDVNSTAATAKAKFCTLAKSNESLEELV